MCGKDDELHHENICPACIRDLCEKDSRVLGFTNRPFVLQVLKVRVEDNFYIDSAGIECEVWCGR